MLVRVNDTTAQDQPVPRSRIVGTSVSHVSMLRVLQLFETWVADDRDRYVVMRDVHGVMLARDNPRLHAAHEQADLVAPDGVPLVWAARLSGSQEISRVCGPDLLLAACEYGVSRNWRHYLVGGAPGVAEMLQKKLAAKFPGIKIVGTQCPPFRDVTTKEDRASCAAIRAARPDFVWVGLGTPKQEIWMANHRGKYGGAIQIGVGAAFDIHAGLISRAPIWMQSYGLEWAHRLVVEPRRLWSRYLKLAPIFLIFASWELIKKHAFRGRVSPESRPIENRPAKVG